MWGWDEEFHMFPYPFLIPAPLILYDDLVNEFFVYLDNLIFTASNRPIAAPPCPNAVKNGVRVSRIKTTFGFVVPLKIQRYKCPSGKTLSPNPLTLPNGRYDVRFAYLASIFYTLGVSAEDTAKILEFLFNVKVSNKTVLDWVRYIGEHAFREHRERIRSILRKGAVEHIELDELYVNFDIDLAPYGITLVIEPATSLILDIYVFRGSQITNLDVETIVSRNKELFDKAKFITTDGAKAYKLLERLSSGQHIICLQHTTRNKGKSTAIKKLMEQLTKREKERVLREAEAEISRWIDELDKRLSFVLPSSFTVLSKFKKQMIEKLREEGRAILAKYEKDVDAYLELYKAYLHHLLYTSQNAALVGKLFMKEQEAHNEEIYEGDNCNGRNRGITRRIGYYSKVIKTTAAVEGLNRVIRERFKKALNYKNPSTIMSVVALLAINHNTRAMYNGSTPYQRAGIDASKMAYNPFKFLGGAYERNFGGFSLDDAGNVTTYREVYGHYRKKARKLRYRTVELPSTDEKVDWAILVRDKILLEGYL